nr:formin-like protein 6 [Lolium perenne]
MADLKSQMFSALAKLSGRSMQRGVEEPNRFYSQSKLRRTPTTTEPKPWPQKQYDLGDDGTNKPVRDPSEGDRGKNRPEPIVPNLHGWPCPRVAALWPSAPPELTTFHDCPDQRVTRIQSLATNPPFPNPCHHASSRRRRDPASLLLAAAVFPAPDRQPAFLQRLPGCELLQIPSATGRAAISSMSRPPPAWLRPPPIPSDADTSCPYRYSRRLRRPSAPHGHGRASSPARPSSSLAPTCCRLPLPAGAGALPWRSSIVDRAGGHDVHHRV